MIGLPLVIVGGLNELGKIDDEQYAVSTVTLKRPFKRTDETVTCKVALKNGGTGLCPAFWYDLEGTFRDDQGRDQPYHERVYAEPISDTFPVVYWRANPQDTKQMKKGRAVPQVKTATRSAASTQAMIAGAVLLGVGVIGIIVLLVVRSKQKKE